MASKYKRQSTGGRFKQRGAGDLGSGAIKAQADVVIDSLKLQRARTAEYSSDYVQGMKGVENTEEWNQELLSSLEDKKYQAKRDAIKVRQAREVEALKGKAKEYGQKAEFWKDFSTTYSKQWGELAKGVTDLGLRAAADKELDKLRQDEFFKSFEDQDKLQEVVEKLLDKQIDENFKDPKSLNTLTKLFNSQNKYLRAGILKELKTQLPAIELSIEDTIRNNPDLEWSASTIQNHYVTFGKNLINKFDLGNSKEGRELLQIFNKFGHLKTEYQRNVDDVESDSENINNSINAWLAFKDDPNISTARRKTIQKNLYHSVGSAKRKSGDSFVVGYDNFKANLIAVAEALAPHSPGEAKDFVDDLMGFPTPGNSDVDFNKRNKEPLANAKLREDLTKIHNDVWNEERKKKDAAHKAKDLSSREIVRERLKTLDPGDVENWTRGLSAMKDEFAGLTQTQDFLSSALLFNFPSKNGILINDDLTKAGNEADLKRMESIYPYLPKSLQEEWKEVREDIQLQSTVTDSTKLKADATKAIKQINDDEGLNPTSDSSTNDAIRAWVQTYQLSWRDTRGKGNAQERHSIAKEYANNAANTNAGLFRRGKNAYGNMDWLAFVDENNKWTFLGRKKDAFGRGLNEQQLENKLANMTVPQLLKSNALGSREGIGGYSVAPLDEYDKIEKTIAAGGVYTAHPNFVKIWRSQSGDSKTWKSLTDIINELRVKTIGGSKQDPILELEETDILQPGMLEKSTYEVNTSKINFPDYVYYPPQDRISIGVFANMSKNEGFNIQDYFDKDVTNILTESELAGFDPIDYINQPRFDPTAVFTQPKLKSSIDPNSIPGKVLKQRYEDSKAGKIQRGSRSYQLPDHTRAREIDGKILSYDEYKGMPFYIKILEEAGRLDEIEKIRGTK